MVEQKKKDAKQASISAFFQPRKPGQQDEAEPKAVGAKRPRVSSHAANSEAKSEQEPSIKPPATKKAATAKGKAKSKTKASKAKAKASPKPKKKKKALVRFISPHAVVDDEEDEDLDDDEDVFNTPEAKRARAELETGGETVPAGAPISDDAVVNEEDIVDVSDDAEKKAVEADTNVEVTEERVVDLTAATAVKVKPEESEDSKKGRKAAKSPVARKTKAVAKTPTKRQQKMKEKAAAEAKPAPVEPLDPAVQARVDTYKLKTDELTRQYTELLHSKQDSDVIMQELYGVALDRDLDVAVDNKTARRTLSETWQKLRDHAKSTNNAAEMTALPSTVEFPHEVKCMIVKGIQGRTASLSVVTSELLASFKKEMQVGDVDMEADSAADSTSNVATEAIDSAASLAVEMEIKMLAQRTPHGIRPAKANIFEDTSADALWVWEVGNLEKYFVDEAQKTVKRMRKHRKRLGQQLKTLARVVQLLHQKPVDEAKVSAEEAKVGKFGFVVDAELQKVKDRETKEQEKLHAVEEKRRHELERQQVKDEEKRKREREKEEKRGVSAKRQKQFKQFFSSKTSHAEAAATNCAGTAEPAIDITGHGDVEKTSEAGETRSAKIIRMDAAISFLGTSEDASSSSPSGSPQLSIFSSLKGKRDTTRKQADIISPDSWSGQRHHNSTLGVMKLLQFYENVRPAYYGTFSSRSRLFHGGRRPFAQYSKFDYSVDSDDEWEEEEPGESLSDAENDGDESDEDNLDYGDQWLAYEDEVDYMDDLTTEDDAIDRGEGPSSPTKHKLPSQLQKKRVKAKSVKPAKLEPRIVGPYWCAHNGSNDCAESHFLGLAGELLCEPVFESTLMRKAREYEEEQKRLEVVRLEQQRKKELQQELDKQKAKQKKAQEAAGAAAAVKPAAVTQAAEKTTKKTTPQKKAKLQKATPQKVIPQKATPLKATPQKKAIPQKSKVQKPSAKHPASSPSPGHNKSTSATATATPSPAKSIESFFKKVDGPLPTSTPAPQPQQQPQPQQGEQKPKEGSIEVISVD